MAFNAQVVKDFVDLNSSQTINGNTNMTVAYSNVSGVTALAA